MVTGGILHAEAGSGIGDQTGGAVVIDGTEIIITAKVLAQGDENGGDISVSGSESVTIGGNMDARGGESGTSSQAGGTITISTPTHLEISKSLTAAADDFDGIITLRYCTKDFSGADFDPAPIEESSCGGSSILPLMRESEREEMVAQSENTNESMQESAGGNISGAGVSATENSENASSAPPAEDSAMQNNYELDGETAIVSPESTGDEISPDISQGSGESLLPEEDNAQESGASPEPAGIEPAAPEIALPDTNLQETPLPDSTSQDTDSGSGDADTSGNEPAGREEDSISGEIIIIPDADSGSSGDASSETGNAPSDGA